MTIEIHCFPYYIHLPIPIGKNFKKAECRKTKWKMKIGQFFKEDAVCRLISIINLLVYAVSPKN